MDHNNTPDPSPSDHVGDGIQAAPGAWHFGGEVWRGFDDHIRRSIPQYEAVHYAIVSYARELLPASGQVYELGSSTGTLSHKLSQALPQANIIGVDFEPAMVEAAQSQATPNLSFCCSDVRSFPLQPCQLVVLCYTLQFLPLADRLPLLQKIQQQLQPGGALILSEKVIRSDANFQALCQRVHHACKRDEGFTQAEIEAKERSLEGVLIPLSEQDNIQLLQDAGFTRTHSIFRNTSFETWIALK